jgi:hypothetical protein
MFVHGAQSQWDCFFFPNFSPTQLHQKYNSPIYCHDGDKSVSMNLAPRTRSAMRHSECHSRLPHFSAVVLYVTKHQPTV